MCRLCDTLLGGHGGTLKSRILFGGNFGGSKFWEFSVCGVNVLAPLWAGAPYGTYNPVYGGEGGGSSR